ncbi:MAG TPA: tetratricopeptide repeat protein [Candidatus Acidoferrum sp.]|nr:tetratricopeptide repeat protein [Candidatus Acidoferrum sp.]
MFQNRILAKLGLWMGWCLLLTSGGRAQEKVGSRNESNLPESTFQSAQTFQLAGDYEKAAVAYREAIAVALQHLGNLSISHREYAEGVDLLTRATQIEPANVTIRVDLAIARFETQDFDKAKAEIETALQQDPRDIRALNLAGKIYFIRGEYQLAVERLESAVGLQPDFDTGYLLALANLELKKPAAASVIFDEMLASYKPNASTHVLIGLAYRETGYYEQAASHFSKALQLEPKKPRLRSSLGLTYYLQGPLNYAKAREEFLAELSITPNDYTSLYYLGMIAAGEQKSSEAEKWFERAVSARPDDPDARFRLGQAYFDEGKFEQAVTALQKSSTISGQKGDQADPALAHELTGQALGKLGRAKEAEAEMAQAAHLRGQSPKPDSLQKANTSAGTGEAEKIGRAGPQELRAMLLQMPHAAGPPSQGEADYLNRMAALLGEAYHNLGVIDARASRYPDAASEFAEAARWNPNIQRLDHNWGLAAFRAERYQQAVGPLERELSRAPNDASIRQMLGLSYYMTDQFKKSAETFRSILDELPDNPGLLYAAGVSLVRSGDSAAGGRLFSRMLEHGSNNPEVHLMVGQAYSEQSQYTEALAEFARAIEMNPRLPEAHYSMGMIYFKQGKLDEAAQEFNAELSLNANAIPAMYQLAYVRLQQHQAEEAIRLLNGVLAQKPSYGDAHYQLGKALLDQGDTPGAIRQLETATQLQPDQSYGYYQLSLAYRRAGRLKDAEKALRTYQDLKDKRSRLGLDKSPSK